MDPRDAAWNSAQWKTSSYSANGANCVEYAAVDNDAGVRDSKSPRTDRLVFPAASWSSFTARVKR